MFFAVLFAIYYLSYPSRKTPSIINHKAFQTIKKASFFLLFSSSLSSAPNYNCAHHTPVLGLSYN